MAGMNKIFVPLNGKPLVSHGVQAIHDAGQVTSIVLVLSSSDLERGRRLLEAQEWPKVRDVCVGGERRQDSVRNGLARLPDSDWVIVHDGARPFIDKDTIARGLAEAELTGAAVAAVPVKDTIKSADSELFVTQTLRRDGLWAVQTPQVFRRRLLDEAHRRVLDDVTDDAAMVERTGVRVRIFKGSYHNIKVTTPEDLPIAEAILRARESDTSWDSQ
jgi:2-C-methyl-D-erythritol 4-phosphate cytidylyltransferase